MEVEGDGVVSWYPRKARVAAGNAFFAFAVLPCIVEPFSPKAAPAAFDFVA